MRLLLTLLATVTLAAACSTSAASETKRVYATGLVHASVFALDADNRLWVATAAYTDDGTDGVYLVANEGATPAQVVTGLHTPLGLLWYRDELYVASKSGVVAYGGFDGTKFARHRTVVTLPDDVGEINNIVLAPDGRILMGISTPCDHCTPTSKWSGTIVSFLPAGTDLKVYASGMRAPVGLAFLPDSDNLYVTLNQRDDLADATPGDWFSLVAEDSAWGFPECYGQGGDACAGVPTPTAVLDQHAAVSGVAFVGSDAFVAEWAKGTVLRVTLAGKVTPFLTDLKNPVAVLATPDGSLLVGDWTTGTVYRVAFTA